MPTVDVVVIGAGLAGMTAALALAEAGASVEVVARGHTATHWTSGGLDVAAPPGHQAADLAAQPDRLGRPRGDHRQCLAPAHPACARNIGQRDEIPCVLSLIEQEARVVVVNHSDCDLHARIAHPPDVRLGRGDLLEARRKVVEG